MGPLEKVESITQATIFPFHMLCLSASGTGLETEKQLLKELH